MPKARVRLQDGREAIVEIGGQQQKSQPIPESTQQGPPTVGSNILPTILGIAGGGVGAALGGPLGLVAGSAAGGVAGKQIATSLQDVIARFTGRERPQPLTGKQIGKEAAVGAVSPLIGGIIGKVAGRPIAKAISKLPVKKFIRALNPAKTDILGGQFPAQEFVKRGFAGTIDQMQEQANKIFTRTQPIKDKFLKQFGSRIIATQDDLIKSLNTLVKEEKGAAASTQAIGKFIDRLKSLLKQKAPDGRITLKATQEIIESMDKKIGSAFKRAKTGQNLPPDTDARIQIANLLRDARNKALPKEFAEAMTDRHIATLIKRALTNREVSRPLLDNLATGLLTGLGGAAGFPVGGFGGVAAGGAIGGALARGLQSVPVRTGIAQALRPLAGAAAGPAAGVAGQTLLRTLLRKSVGQ